MEKVVELFVGFVGSIHCRVRQRAATGTGGGPTEPTEPAGRFSGFSSVTIRR
jgi:hypothetical protein